MTSMGESIPTDHSSRELHYLAKSLLFAIPAVSIGIQISTWIGFALSDMKDHVDFGTFYRAGWLIRTSQIDKLYPTNPPTFDFIHPAYEAPLFVPLTFLHPRAAQLVWMAVNLCMVLLTIYLLRDHFRYTRAHHLAILALAFFPLTYAIAQGQDSLLLTILIGVAFIKLERGEHFAAGAMLGLAAFRFQFLLPIALLFLAWKMFKAIAGMTVGAGFCLLASIAVTGIPGQIQYVKMLRLLADPSSQPVHRMSNLRGVLDAANIQSPIALSILSLAVVLWLIWSGRKVSPEHKLLVAVTASCLLSYHLFMHDMSVLVIPLLLLFDAAMFTADYWVLGLLGACILAPEVIILYGSAYAMWACAIVPTLLLVAETATYPRFVTR
jgi:hypothetical protein